MRPKRFMKYCSICVLIFSAGLGTARVMGQAKEEIKQQAEAQLTKMSPDQIDAKIKEYGMTRQEAETRAQQYGIDLDSFLSKYPSLKSSPIPPPAQTTIIVEQPKTSAPPSQTTPVENLVAKESAGKNLPPLTSEDASIFGLSFFRRAASSFQPSPSIADKEYVVGAGDVLKISLWGQLQSIQEVEVDNEGRVTLPTVGPVLVSGYTIEDAKNRIKIALSQAYAGLVSKPPTIFFDLSLSKLRPVRVFFMGEVENPGGYFVNNFASVFNSLFVVGGPKRSGSLRDVRMIRNNKVVAKVDLYDYLFGSVKTADVRVNDNDIIYVPLKGKRATIRGEVLRSSTFELLPGENLRKLIEFSGGLQPTMYRDRVQIDRIVPFNERVKGTEDRKIFDVDFKDISEGKKDFTLEDGDVVTLFSIIERQENYVTIAGDVRRPGRFQSDKLKTIKDLINAADGLWPTAYLRRAELMRESPSKKLAITVLNLEKVMANDPLQNVVLQKRDSLRIYSIYELNPPQTITLSGHAKSPGTYRYADSMTVRRIILSLVGLEDSVYRANTFLDRGDIFRLNEDLITRKTVQVDLAKILDRSAGDVAVQPGDEIRIYGLDEIAFIQKSVQVFGSIKAPGTYRLNADMTLTDLILQAGGYTQDAWTMSAEIARVTRIENARDSVVKIVFAKLPDLFDTARSAISILHSPAGSFGLVDKDQVFIRPNPDYKAQQQVGVIGEVKFPGLYVIAVSRERLSDVIRRAGGLTKDGYARGGILVRNGEAFRANMEEALGGAGGSYDPVLFPGDQITIPHHPNTVRVKGEVNNPGAYSYVEGKSRDFYIESAGGLTDSSDFALVTFPEGYVVKTSLGWLGGNPAIPDGSSIYVAKEKPEPPKPPEVAPKTTFYDMIKDVMALTASTVTIIVLLKQVK